MRFSKNIYLHGCVESTEFQKPIIIKLNCLNVKSLTVNFQKYRQTFYEIWKSNYSDQSIEIEMKKLN